MRPGDLRRWAARAAGLTCAAAAAALALSASPAAGAVYARCSGTIEGADVKESILVPAGATCTLKDSTVQGNVAVDSGAALTAEAVTIRGSVRAEHATVTVHFREGSPSLITGNLTIDGGGPLVLLGAHVEGAVRIKHEPAASSPNLLCADTIDRNLQVRSDETPSLIGQEGPCKGLPGNQIAGDAVFRADRVGSEPAAIVARDEIGGNLKCERNHGAVGTEAGTSVGGRIEGECASLTTCETGQSCSASAESPETAFMEIRTDEASSGPEVVLIAFGPPPIGCSTPGTANAVASYEVLNPAPGEYKTLIYQALGKYAEIAEQAHPIEEGSFFGYLCFEGPESFTTASGAPAKKGPNGFYGELPPCNFDDFGPDLAPHAGAPAAEGDIENPPCVSFARYGPRDSEGPDKEPAYEVEFVAPANEPRAGP